MSIDHIVEQHYTLGIAGHIDHGKTTLTKALTGKETDRLKEEQLRKISIELGFASFPLSNGKNVGVIDVPGHERFIRQMVAGVAGIDLVLLVIAADEGVMPQTREHVDILQLLGIKRGIIVLTKVDLVDEEFLELVKESVMEEVEGTFLEDSLLIEVDSLSNRGIDQLKKEVELITNTISSRSVQGIARLPIDRVFSKKGFGTIVTGTMYQGKISVGDELQILPNGHKVKVRNLQVHDHPQQTAFAGQRVALNLSDVSVDDVERGDVLCTKKAIDITSRVDIEFHMLDHLDFPIKQRSDIRLHVGTSEVLGRIVLFDRNEVQPGETCYAQLELTEPIITLFEERFVLRRPTPMTTIGGGMVIDPYAKKHRFGSQTVEIIAAKKEGDLPTRAAHILDNEGMQTLHQLTYQLGISIEDWRKEITDHSSHGLKLIIGDTDQLTLITTLPSWNQIWATIQEELEGFHKRYPLREGIERLKIQKQYYPSLTAAQWNVVLKEATTEEKILIKQESISLHNFQPVLREKDKQIWTEIQYKMKTTGIEVPPWEQLIPAQMNPENSLDLQKWLLRNKELVQLEENRFLSKELLDQLVLTLKERISSPFSIQEIKEVITSSRKFMIPFLETLDRQGYTNRKENERTWR
jgi:selenocysteine-specific elongation factor